ncbi:claspin [Bombyx mori]|uniref:claspin n=1 Tax=Bombyx mori TaxID=7091 RepID=UPI002ED5411C
MTPQFHIATMKTEGLETKGVEKLWCGTNINENDSVSENMITVHDKSISLAIKSSAGRSDTSDEDGIPVVRVKRRVKQFSDSGSDIDKEILHKYSQNADSSSDSENGVYKLTNKQAKKNSDSNSFNSREIKSLKNDQQQLRMKNKRNKLREKFKNLVQTKGKVKQQNISESEKDSKKISEDSEDDAASVDNIKQKIKEKLKIEPSHFKLSVCDPDTSSDEEEKELENIKLKLSKQNKKSKCTQPTSPKPMRMTAKIAMENMQKIKSESNRMLREKQVSLPYHRPKALSLKDIMSRRKPAVSADGKALPIKMNEEQLKQYAQQLNERQKEMMELCKSDTEDENDSDNIKTNIENNEVKESVNNASLSVDKLYTEKDNVVTENVQNELNLDQNEDSSDLIRKENGLNSSEEKILDEKDKSITKQNHQVEITEALTEGFVSTTRDDQINTLNNVIYNHFDNSTDSSNINAQTQRDSEQISLHFDSETYTDNKLKSDENCYNKETTLDQTENYDLFDDYSDQHMNMINIENIVNNVEVNKAKDQTLNIKPKLTGAPGMVIDLDDGDPTIPKKLSGVELLKERFTYFAKLKTPEEAERERENRLKPGALLLKLKQELEEEIAEKRSLEWARRLEEEKKQELELKALRGETSEAEDEIEKLDRLGENLEKESSGESEEDLIEDDIDMVDKSPNKNTFITDEAEESECDDDVADDQVDNPLDSDNNEKQIEDEAGDSEINEDDETSESSEEEHTTVGKKGRILKAFEDSDDEERNDDLNLESNNMLKVTSQFKANIENSIDRSIETEERSVEKEKIQTISDSQDDIIQLAQAHKSVSDELFTSLESVLVVSDKNIKEDEESDCQTQTFSILKSINGIENELGTEDSETPSLNSLKESDTKGWKECLGPSKLLNTQNSQASTSQPIGEDILALCTGQFYENEFISQINEEDKNVLHFINEEFAGKNDINMSSGQEKNSAEDLTQTVNNSDAINTVKPKDDGILLQSILDELHDPEFDTPKQNKYFCGSLDSNIKKKFIIDSDDEENKTEAKVGKNHKKKKREKRALQISDDEDEDEELEETEEYQSEIDDNNDDDADRNDKIVEYDSEENEVEVKVQYTKKKRTTTEFFENEAELTSEDEWIGSGDEDEAGLDRMEREEGDDETFNQRKLQRELGQIHMRDVMDQDKREVRIIQELLFEDGDLGDGHRQRKFRWRNNEDDEQMGTIVGDYTDTQEEDFESEEQWRKQRHEREIFLKQMQSKDDNEDCNISIDRTTIIKANLCSKTMSTLLQEMKKTDTRKTEDQEKYISAEKKSTRDIPSPKKAYSIFQQNYHGSLLTRGNGALARLAALATPLAINDDSPKVGSLVPTNRRNFVFSSVTPDKEPKGMKRKADSKPDTPRLMKKLKATDKQTLSKNSLLDHLKVSWCGSVEMAKENTVIGDIVKKSKVLLLDIEGTTTSISFVKDKLFPYAEENVKDFLDAQWDDEDVKEAVNALRKLAIEDQEKSVEGLVTIPGEDASKEDQIEGLVKNVKWQMSSDRKVAPLKQLQGLIWKKGYDKGDIKGHVYDDVLPALEQWRSVEGQKIYIYSSGSVQAQKLLFGQSSAGDLLPLIDGHFDTAVGAKQEATSYTAIVEKIGCKAEEILFLTDIEKEAEAARTSGVNVALVSREGNAPLAEGAAAAYPVLHSFTQLTVTNKRKPDTQEEIPAKIPKTDVNDDCKTNSEELIVETTAKDATVEKASEEPEKMEVEESISVPANDSTKTKGTNDCIETIVEEVTETEIAEATAIDIEPVVIEETVDKAEEKTKTEKMEEDPIPDVKSLELPIEKVCTEAASVPEKTTPTTITEIEEVLDDKQNLTEVADVIEDIEPIVEEPETVEDIEELKNVGEVLDKECDEILSKVQDVTNLDSIPVKPLLNSIPEETMDTENIDSNNIIEKILEAEMELGVQDGAKGESETVDGVASSKISTAENCENEQLIVSDPKSNEKDVSEKTVPLENTESSPIEKTDDRKAEPSEELAIESQNKEEEIKMKTEENIREETVERTEVVDNQEQNKVEEDEQSADIDKKIGEHRKEIIESVPQIEKETTKLDTNERSAASESKEVEETKMEQELVTDKNIPEATNTNNVQAICANETEATDTTVEKVDEVKVESDNDPQVNGNSANGNDKVNLNGDSAKDEELNARLSAENGKEVNGANGDVAEQVNTDKKSETEISEIKVKTVAAEESCNDPIEQPSVA